MFKNTNWKNVLLSIRYPVMMIYWSILNDIIVKTLNRLDPERFEWKIRLEIFKLILVTDGCGI